MTPSLSVCRLDLGIQDEAVAFQVISTSWKCIARIAVCADLRILPLASDVDLEMHARSLCLLASYQIQRSSSRARQSSIHPQHLPRSSTHVVLCLHQYQSAPDLRLYMAVGGALMEHQEQYSTRCLSCYRKDNELSIFIRTSRRTDAKLGTRSLLSHIIMCHCRLHAQKRVGSCMSHFQGSASAVQCHPLNLIDVQVQITTRAMRHC
jgi:hypothetical protein